MLSYIPVPPPPPAKKRKLWLWIVGSIAGVFVLCTGALIAIGFTVRPTPPAPGDATLAPGSAPVRLAQPSAPSASAVASRAAVAARPTTTTPSPRVTTTAAVSYANCAAAERAGVAPLYRGDPGYRSALDPDGDGQACGEPEPEPEPEPQEDVYYANCAEAKRAGVAPLYRGEPGYRSGLDRDNDGDACE